MNKQELIAAIAKKANVSKAVAADTLDGFMASVKDSLQAGESVQLTGFGSFQVSDRAARQGRNPRTGATIDIPAKKIAKFKPGKALDLG